MTSRVSRWNAFVWEFPNALHLSTRVQEYIMCRHTESWFNSKKAVKMTKAMKEQTHAILGK